MMKNFIPAKMIPGAQLKDHAPGLEKVPFTITVSLP